jgi:SAM-dependent methyltransferase
LPYPDNSFDVALLQAVLHHVPEPIDIIREALRLAPEIIVLEPNGYNLGLKVIERTSSYHRAHHERSYSPRRLDQWVADAGGTVVSRRFVGLVPVFCPNWMARALRVVEPVVERVPLLRDTVCALYVFQAKRNDSP